MFFKESAFVATKPQNFFVCPKNLMAQSRGTAEQVVFPTQCINQDSKNSVKCSLLYH